MKKKTNKQTKLLFVKVMKIHKKEIYDNDNYHHDIFFLDAFITNSHS